MKDHRIGCNTLYPDINERKTGGWTFSPQKIMDALKKRGQCELLNKIDDVIESIPLSKLMTGGRGGWRASPWWILEGRNLEKILSGQYHDSGFPQKAVKKKLEAPCLVCESYRKILVKSGNKEWTRPCPSCRMGGVVGLELPPDSLLLTVTGNPLKGG